MKARKYLKTVTNMLSNNSRDWAVAAMIYLWLEIALIEGNISEEEIAYFILRWLPLDELELLINRLRKDPSSPVHIRRSSYRLWLFLTATSLKDSKTVIAILGSRILASLAQNDLLGVSNLGWHAAKTKPELVLECRTRIIEEEMTKMGLNEGAVEAVRAIFRDDKMRERFTIW